MPTKAGKDSKGPFMRWGTRGKKYHYTAGNAASRASAKRKADKQGEAIHASGFKGK